LPENRDAEVIEQEQRTQPDEQRRADRGIHLHVPQTEPLFGRLSQLFALGGVVGVDHHIEVERRGAKAEDRSHAAAGTVADGDQRTEDQDLGDGFHHLAVVNGSHAWNESQRQGDAGAGTGPCAEDEG
jgi:hypothetical protein